ncbi:MAG: hypothetical protein KGJ90_04580 [Patescibacteria group bacterium]|nr:hypothetical protein [Patescibacteria group bacterium]
MNFQQVQAQINDLPNTFKRIGVPYTQFIDALTAALYIMTMGVDGMVAQGSFPAAAYGWLDAWGLLFNIQRGNNQPDQSYSKQIQYTVNVSGGPPLYIVAWILAIFGVSVQIQENIPDLGYVLTFPQGLTQAQITTIIASLSYVRPAGVPFVVEQANIGLYPDTINFINGVRVTGSWISGGEVEVPLGIGSTVNNAPVSVPTLLLTDPTLNP